MTIRPSTDGTNSYGTALLPCPMCGKEAAIGKTTLQRDGGGGEYKTFTGYSVNCIWCGVNNRSIAEGFKTPELAAEHWNKRCDGPQYEQWNAAIDAACAICDGQAIKQAQGAEGDMEQYRKARAWDANYLSARIRDLRRTDAARHEQESK